ncbi:hypothetical protein GJ744_011928 [Endocarpon pusillum]|uniref:CFEM domain-containing protein n=1 Tax=Endocarpon pusillum TaxID=364733 RepID=A0A8H7AXB3_9EURO|nr:hypothetical protein GJ744_011928 [Endocarpon pusillum]
MKLTSPSIVAACVLAQQAAATYNWGSAKSFSNPANTNNQCTDDQKSGFDWADLPIGGFDSYKGFDFSGFDCSSGGGKRSLNTRTGSPGKYIQGKVGKNGEAAPKISCSDGKGFSITDMEVSTSYDTDIDFIYDMPDGSTCKHTESCSTAGGNVKNNQCGGAVSVTLQKPEHASDDDCDVGIHSVGFDCEPASTPTPSYTTVEASSTTAPSSEASSLASSLESFSTPQSSLSVPNTETSSVAETSTASTSSKAAPESSPSSTVVAPTPSNTIPITSTSTVESPTAPPTPIDSSIPMTTSTVYSTFTSTTYGCSSDVPDCPASSIKVVTMTTAVYTTICPVTSVPIPETSAPVAETSSPAPETSAAVPETSVPAAETSVSVPETSADVPGTSAPVPETSLPGTETKTAPAASTPTSVLPGFTPAPSSSVPGSSYPVPESSTDVLASSASSEAIVKTSALPPAPSEMVTTEIVYTTTTECPITLTSTSGSSTIITTSVTVSETVITSTVTVCTKCTEAPPTTLTSAPSATTPASIATSLSPDTTVTGASSAEVPTSVLPGSVSSAAPLPSDAPCPEILPSCLNTWLSLVPHCSSNSDASCYCPSKAFTDAVIGCVQAWGASANEMSAALSYFTGICAASVPENPAIITAVPSTITLCPTAQVSTATVPTTATATVPGQTDVQPAGVTSMVTSIVSAPAQTPQVPVTVISYTQTVSPATGGTGSVATNAVTVPQVSFITNTVVPATPIASAGPSSGVAPQAVTSVGLVPAPVITTTPTAGGAFNGSTKASPTSSVALYTGSAVKFDANGIGAGVAAFAGILAFLV